MRPGLGFLFEKSPGTHSDALPGRTVKSYLGGKDQLHACPLTNRILQIRRFILDECVGDFASTEIAPDHFLIADNTGKRVGSAWEERTSSSVESRSVSGERSLLYIAWHTFYVILTTGRSDDEDSAQKSV
jgi:hypothetical protein